MTKFKKKTRYDKKLAQEGIWLEVKDGDEYYYSFKVTLFDITTNRAEAQVAELKETYGDKLKDEKFSESWDWLAISFVNTQIVDWKDVEDEDGNPIPFTRESCLEFFMDEDNRWMLPQLMGDANNMALYRAEKVEAIEGNSSPSSTGNKEKQKAK